MLQRTACRSTAARVDGGAVSVGRTARGQGGNGDVDNGRAGTADTFPKLLIHNAATRGSRVSMRHKDLGIWQSWDWAQVLDEVRAFSAGLSELGLKRGDNYAVIGQNRPRLYWAMCAGQALGAVPVPRSARRSRCCRSHRASGRRWCGQERLPRPRSRSSRTRSRSTRYCRSPTACRSSRTSSTTSRAACATTTAPRSPSSTTCRRPGAQSSQSRENSPPGRRATPCPGPAQPPRRRSRGGSPGG